MYVIVATKRYFDEGVMQDKIGIVVSNTGTIIKTTPDIIDYGLCKQDDIQYDETAGQLLSKLPLYLIVEFKDDGTFELKDDVKDIDNVNNMEPILEPIPEEFLIIDSSNKTVSYDRDLVLQYYKNNVIEKLDNMISELRNKYYVSIENLMPLLNEHSISLQTVYNVTNIVHKMLDLSKFSTINDIKIYVSSCLNIQEEGVLQQIVRYMLNTWYYKIALQIHQSKLDQVMTSTIQELYNFDANIQIIEME